MTDELSGQEVPPEDLPSGSEVPPEDLPSEDTSTAMSGQEVPTEDLPDQDIQSQFSTPEQKVLTGIESVGRGVTGGLSDVLAVGMRKGASALGVPENELHWIAPAPENIVAREQANPVESATGEIAGNIALMSKLPKVGSTAINSMLQMGLISGGDELSKAMLGQGDPASAVAWHIAGSGALGLAGGAIAQKTASLGNLGLKTIENTKLGTDLKSFLTGIGHAATFPGTETVNLADSAITNAEASGLNNNAFKIGQKMYQNIPKYIARIGAPFIGAKIGGVGTAAASYGIEQLLEKSAPGISKKLAPSILKIAASETTENIGDVLDHASSMSNGFKQITNGINNLFEGTANQAIDYVTDPKKREKLNNFIENGGVNQEIQNEQQEQNQNFAEGGMVLPTSSEASPIANIYPEQNILMNASKARMSNYLNSMRPVESPTRPFDVHREDPHKKREYEKTLDLAIQPLSILNKIKDGSLNENHMKSFTAMYPELHAELSKKITERMAQDKLDEEKRPPYKVRQALSLFMGSSLDSTMTPQNMMAAQATFIQQNNQKAMANAKASGLLKNAKMGQTNLQGATERLNKT